MRDIFRKNRVYIRVPSSERDTWIFEACAPYTIAIICFFYVLGLHVVFPWVSSHNHMDSVAQISQRAESERLSFYSISFAPNEPCFSILYPLPLIILNLLRHQREQSGNISWTSASLFRSFIVLFQSCDILIDGDFGAAKNICPFHFAK